MSNWNPEANLLGNENCYFVHFTPQKLIKDSAIQILYEKHTSLLESEKKKKSSKVTVISSIFLKPCVRAAAVAKPLIKQRKAKCHKEDGKKLVIILSVSSTGPDQWPGWFPPPQLWPSKAQRACHRHRDMNYSRIFEEGAKNNFPHVTFPTKTTKSLEHCRPHHTGATLLSFEEQTEGHIWTN